MTSTYSLCSTLPKKSMPGPSVRRHRLMELNDPPQPALLLLLLLLPHLLMLLPLHLLLLLATLAAPIIYTTLATYANLFFQATLAT